MLDIVIARYKEDISWTSKISHNIIIYNKYFTDESNPLNNVGREAHTYLHHIINNYNNLADYTAFLQGNPFDHCHDIINIIDNFTDTNTPIYLGHKICEPIISIPHPQCPNGLPIYYFISLLFDNISQSSECVFNAGAQFIIPKCIILNREIKFYEILYKLCSFHENSLEPYIYERLWQYIFDTNYVTSNRLKSLYN